MFDQEHVRLGIAPIGWSNDDLPDLGAENSFNQCISEMALAGFSGCEIGHKYPQDPAELKSALAEHGLIICNAWFSAYLTSRPRSETIAAFKDQTRRLQLLGASVIGVSEQGNSIQGRQDLSIFTDKTHYSKEQWELIIRGFSEMGRIAVDHGLTLTIHHHMGTGIQTGWEIEYLMENTDPALVSLLYDTGHLAFAGEDASAILEKYISRVRHVHLKDIRLPVLRQARQQQLSFLAAVRQGVFTVPGDGDIDFKPVFRQLAEYGYRGWLVVEAEQDPAIANPLEYARKARQYIRQTTGI